MEEFFGNLFKKDNASLVNENTKQLNNNTERVNINDNTLRKLIKRADIKLAHKNVYSKVNNLYENITRDYANNVDKIVFHRKGKRIGVKDTYLLNNLLNQNMFGGNYSGYCDNNIGQCSDSFSSAQCGGFIEFCDGHPTQCSGSPQKGGFIEFCDGHPTQCSGSPQKGGSLSKKQFKNLFKKYSSYTFSKDAINNIHQMVENDLVHYLNNQKTEKKVFNNLN